jgi:hypothetical protein
LINKEHKNVNKGHDESQKSKDGLTKAFGEAFDRATRWFGNLLAPLIIIAYAKDVQQAFDFVVARPALTAIFALIFVAVFAYNILKTLKIQLIRDKKIRTSQSNQHNSRIETKSEFTVTEKISRSRSPQRYYRMWGWLAIFGSLVALILMAYIYVMVFVNGLFYVVIASAPSEQSAIGEIQALNRFFELSGYSDLEARAHASTASGSPWYMISIGGWHASKEPAEATFRRAKEAMGPRMRSDTYIYSTKDISPKRVIIGWVKKKTNRISRIFR